VYLICPKKSSRLPLRNLAGVKGNVAVCKKGNLLAFFARLLSLAIYEQFIQNREFASSTVLAKNAVKGGGGGI
jgi:hypothetical protein